MLPLGLSWMFVQCLLSQKLKARKMNPGERENQVLFQRGTLASASENDGW